MASDTVKLPGISLAGMSDTRLREHIEQLQEIFPYISTFKIRNMLSFCQGNLDVAIDVLSGSPGSSNSQSPSSLAGPSTNAGVSVKSESYETIEDISNICTRRKVSSLLDLGIRQPIDYLVDVLADCNWNVDDAATFLFLKTPERTPPPTREGSQGMENKYDNSRPETSKTTLPPIPPSSSSSERYPGGVIPPFRVSLRTGKSTPSVDFNANPLAEAEDTSEAKATRLQDCLSEAKMDRIEHMLNICDSADEAYEALVEELAQGSENSTSGSDFEHNVELSDSGSSASELAQARIQKRRAETPYGGIEELPAKKLRVSADDKKLVFTLDPAPEWVLANHGQSSGVSIVLSSGTHPCKFPKAVLCKEFDFFRKNLRASEESIELRSLQRETFELAFQMAVCKSFKLVPSKSQSAAITSMFDLALAVDRLGLLQLEEAEQCIAGQFRNILLDNRGIIQGRHIAKAYTLRSGHPIRKVLVQSLAVMYLMSEKSSTPNEAPVYDDEERDPARRHAFGDRDGFRYQDQIDTIAEFDKELTKEALDIFRSHIEVSTGKRTKYVNIMLEDPLTEKVFVKLRKET